jgi:hypothetical protein
MSRFERINDLSGKRERFGKRQRTACNARCKRLALHELEHEKPR